MYLSLTFEHSQTAVGKFEMMFCFPDRSDQVKQFTAKKIHECNESQRELAIVLPYPFDSDLPYLLRQGWRHVWDDDCNLTRLNLSAGCGGKCLN